MNLIPTNRRAIIHTHTEEYTGGKDLRRSRKNEQNRRTKKIYNNPIDIIMSISSAPERTHIVIKLFTSLTKYKKKKIKAEKERQKKARQR
jgi:hypothetical protein